MNCFSRLLSFVFLIILSLNTLAQPSFNAVLVSKVPVIDGRLNDEAWTNACKS